MQAWAATPQLAQVCHRERVSIAAPTLVAIATAMAGHADHASGRHCAATRATIAAAAGCGPDTVTVAWRVLRTAGWVLEAQRGHGSPTTPGCGRRPSIYHLIPTRPVEFPDLPRSGAVRSSTPAGSTSPSAHPRACKKSKRPKNQPGGRGPRPLAIQRLAAHLINRCHGLGRGHAGAICDALTAAGINPHTWTARQITDALNTDMHATGWTWPDHIRRPGAFLAHRLRRIDWTPPTTRNDGGYAAGPDTDTAHPQPETGGSSQTRITTATAARGQQETGPMIGRAALGGAGHTAARAALADAVHRAATRRTHTAAADAAARHRAMHRRTIVAATDHAARNEPITHPRHPSSDTEDFYRRNLWR